MDRLESLTNAVSQITLYDIKSMYNQAKNVVLNVTEMEAKVREATNDDPWGASSTLMQDIAQGTFNFQQFNEIMPCIYARFMEKEARQWRQIYKALQLLEYIIKHGSERVVDDARSHISTIKMLRNFHYIDEKGKDEGINVRNRAKELVELLSDVEKIRTERRKAKANKHKYTGTGNDGFGSGGMSFSSGSSRYGGFGSETMGYGGSGDHDYGSYRGSSSSGGFRDDTRRGAFEEYNAGDDEEVNPRASTSVRTPTRLSTTSSVTAKAKAPAPAAVQEVDLLGGFGDDDAFATPAPGFSVDKALPAVAPPVAQAAPVSLDDDDFADFQAAPVSPTAATMNSAPAITAKPNLMQMLGQTATRPAVTPAQPTIPMQPAFSGMGMGMGGMTTGHRQNLSGSFSPAAQTTAPNYFGGAPIKPSTTPAMTPIAMNPSRPGVTSAAMTPTSTTSSKGGANFDDLWSMSLGSSAKPATNTASQSKSIKDLEKEKAAAGLWGAGGKPLAMGGSSAFGNFGSATGGGSGAANNGDDDLLL
ncbi:ENTH-domain-containing protein [Pleurotus eryngii]|uniref:ENTH-domain-containing protein n=1 Tax=Pleurotus eryngii TaxID=5323 RepID=A0A9P6A6G1_PLEER|nr:ENTH-domain-containing protein [Pleurotus eryngii]